MALKGLIGLTLSIDINLHSFSRFKNNLGGTSIVSNQQSLSLLLWIYAQIQQFLLRRARF